MDQQTRHAGRETSREIDARQTVAPVDAFGDAPKVPEAVHVGADMDKPAVQPHGSENAPPLAVQRKGAEVCSPADERIVVELHGTAEPGFQTADSAAKVDRQIYHHDRRGNWKHAR